MHCFRASISRWTRRMFCILDREGVVIRDLFMGHTQTEEDHMSALKTRERIGLGMLFMLTLASSALAEDISIRGKVQGYDDKPILNIEVGVYDDKHLAYPHLHW